MARAKNPLRRFFTPSPACAALRFQEIWAGPLSPLDTGSSRACKCRWAPYVRDHDPGQGQLPVSTIKAPGHRIPDARSRTRPTPKLGSHAKLRNAPIGAMHEVSIAVAPLN